MNREKKIDTILSRWIIKEILPSKELFKKALLRKKPLTFYIWADPTWNSLHLSHAKNFMLLEEFRQLWHKVYVLFWDLTACIWDPSDKDSARAKLTREQARVNAKSWVNQIKSIIDFDDVNNPAQVVFNSTWFDKFSVTDLLDLFSNATVQQMLERDMFKKRIKDNKPIFLHEFLYPMFQWYDSIALDVDVELCWTDQIFNALTGRTLSKSINNKEKFVVAVNLMENPETWELMSKTKGTWVFLSADAKNMFGQIMSLSDDMIRILLINNTRIAIEDIDKLDIKNNPRKSKIFTALTIVSIFHWEKNAIEAKEHFIDTFSKSTFPSNAIKITLTKNSLSLVSLIKECNNGLSNSEIKRLIKNNAITINKEKYLDEKQEINTEKKLEIKVWKRMFYKIN